MSNRANDLENGTDLEQVLNEMTNDPDRKGYMRLTAGARKHITNRPGVTMVELVFVLIIIGIAGTMAAPRFAGMSHSTKTNAAAAVIQTDLRRAFSEATKNRRPVRITFTNASQRYTVTDRQSGAVIWTRYLSGNTAEYSVASMVAAPTSIDIFPNGIASASLVVTVTVVTQSRRVNMTRVGNVRIT